jgi:hypothetical protein
VSACLFYGLSGALKCAEVPRVWNTLGNTAARLTP